MKNKILSDLYQSREMNDLISKMQPDHLRDEIKQELFLTLCEMDDQRIIGLHLAGQLNFFVTRICLNMVQSSTSPFFKKYRKVITVDIETGGNAAEFDLDRVTVKFNVLGVGAEDQSEVMDRELKQNALLEAVEKCLGEMHWYSRELFLQYVHHGSAGKVIKAMKSDLGGRYIPSRTILDVVKKVKGEIREKVRA